VIRFEFLPSTKIPRTVKMHVENRLNLTIRLSQVFSSSNASTANAVLWSLERSRTISP
jgi:hypothetical protein